MNGLPRGACHSIDGFPHGAFVKSRFRPRASPCFRVQRHWQHCTGGLNALECEGPDGSCGTNSSGESCRLET